MEGMLPRPELRPELQAQLQALSQALGTDVLAGETVLEPPLAAQPPLPSAVDNWNAGVPLLGMQPAMHSGMGAPIQGAALGNAMTAAVGLEALGGLPAGAPGALPLPLLATGLSGRPRPALNLPGPPEYYNSKGFPLRPGCQPCDFYLKFRDCKYGKSCCWDHPEELPDIKYLGKNSKGLPLRPGAMRCSTYLRTGTCAYGEECRCDHPEGEALAVAPSGAGAAAAQASERKRQAAQQAALEIAKTIGSSDSAPGVAVPIMGPTPMAPPDSIATAPAVVTQAVMVEPGSPSVRQNPDNQQVSPGQGVLTTAGCTPVTSETVADEVRPERKKRRRGWDSDDVKDAASSTAASYSAARVEEMVKNWVPSEKQLEAMSVEELQRVLKQWKAESKFTTRDALLAKAKKIIIG